MTLDIFNYDDVLLAASERVTMSLGRHSINAIHVSGIIVWISVQDLLNALNFESIGNVEMSLREFYQQLDAGVKDIKSATDLFSRFENGSIPQAKGDN